MYIGFLGVDLPLEHEPMPSSREMTAPAVSTFNHLDKRDKLYIDDFLIAVIHALSTLVHYSPRSAGGVGAASGWCGLLLPFGC